MTDSHETEISFYVSFGSAAWWGLLPMHSVAVFANPSQPKAQTDQGTDLRPQALLLCLGTGPAPRPRRGLTISQSSILSSCHGSLFSLQGEGAGAGRSLKQLLLRRPRTSQALVVAQESCRAVSLGSQTWDTARKTWLRFRSPPLF